MQLLLLGMLMGVFLYDEGLLRAGGEMPVPWWGVMAAVVATKVGVLGAYAWQCRRTRLTLGTARGPRRFARLERFNAVLPPLLLVMFAGDLMLGWLDAVRAAVGNTVLIDELLALAPTLGVLVLTWAVYYPIDRRLREAAIFRRADAGLPLYPVGSRGQYLLAQTRHQLLVLFVPLLAILTWSESLTHLARHGWITLAMVPWLTPVGAGVVFLFTPLALRHVFDTVPLPAGQVRDRMAALCKTHGVGVRDLLLWRTYGGMINAAVMGLLPPLRYIMLTDGLLDQVREDHVEAVMAHELGHVKRRHLIWLLLAAAALMGGLLGLADLYAAHAAGDITAQTLAVVGAACAWAVCFGWVSRRVERQADTFAARHLSLHPPSFWAEHHGDGKPETTAAGEPAAETPAVFTALATETMAQALQRVADLNHVTPTRRSWRHGSIASRQRYLRSLPNTPLDRASVDRTMRRINLAAVAAMLAMIAAAWWG